MEYILAWKADNNWDIYRRHAPFTNPERSLQFKQESTSPL